MGMYDTPMVLATLRAAGFGSLDELRARATEADETGLLQRMWSYAIEIGSWEKMLRAAYAEATRVVANATAAMDAGAMPDPGWLAQAAEKAQRAQYKIDEAGARFTIVHSIWLDNRG